MSRQELRLAGSGGQGVILASVIVAEAALMCGRHVAQSQSYGPEARGGSCKAEVIVDDRSIGFTKVQRPTFLMALTQKALDTYGTKLPEGCTVLVDSSLEVPDHLGGMKVVSVPILDTARSKVGRLQTANIVAVGCISKLIGMEDDIENVRKAVLMHVPKGTEALNMKALDEGIGLISDDDCVAEAARRRPIR